MVFSRNHALGANKVFTLKSIMFLLVSLTVSLSVSAQNSILDNRDLDSLVLAIATPIYNLHHEEALRQLDILANRIPDHPIVDMLYAMNILWETIPDPQPDNFPDIEKHLFQCISKAEQILETDEDNPEAVFFQLMAHGLLAQYYHEQGTTFKAVGEAKRAYNAVIAGFTLKEEYIEFYFSTGLYNYYREKYPELHPVYKPFVWIFRSGNIAEGLNQLHYASQRTILSKVESAWYLAYIYLRYEAKPTKAYDLLSPLVSRYPRNFYFHTLLLEALMSLEKFEEAAGSVNYLMSSEKWFYKMNGLTYKGLLEEKQNNNPTLAKEYYLRAITLGEMHKNEGMHAKSLAYAGLARVSDRENDIDMAKIYFKKAAKLAQTEAIREEAATYLKSH